MRAVRRMIETGFNTVHTSSCGRLFDAVAAIVGAAAGGEFRGTGGHRAGDDRGARDHGSLSIRYRRRWAVGGGFSPGHRGASCGRRLAAQACRDSLGEVPQHPGGGNCGDVRAHPAGERTEARLPERRDVSEYEAAGGRGGAIARAGVRSIPAPAVPPNDGGIALGQAAVAAARLSGGQGATI